MEDPAGTPALVDAIRHLHGVDAVWLESTPVEETFRGETIWTGTVQTFAVEHAQATRVYAWSYATTGAKRQFVAILGAGPVTSAHRAVQAYIAAEARRRQD